MGRPSGPKNRNGGTWTDSQFNTFIRNQIRGATKRWNPVHVVMKAANRGRGLYECNGCHEVVPVTVRKDGARVKNVFVDHIDPVVDPLVGFVSFDEYIKRMFVEREGLQVLCSDCHTIKTNNERGLAKDRRALEKEDTFEE